MKFIKNWRLAHKFWSVRLSVVGTAIMGFFAVWPDAAMTLWQAMPAEVRRLIPDHVATVIALLLFGASAISRLIRQKEPAGYVAERTEPKDTES